MTTAARSASTAPRARARPSGACCRSSQLSRGEQRERRGRHGRQRGSRLREATRGETPRHGERSRAEIRRRKRAEVDCCGEQPEDDTDPDQGDAERDDHRLPHRIRVVARAEPAGDEGEAQRRLEDPVRSDDYSPVVYETTVSLMARPVDPHRRANTLGRAAHYVLQNASERLGEEIRAEIRRRLAGRRAELEGEGDDAATLVEIWSWVSAEERAPFVRVFFETHVRALSDPKAHRPMIDDWLRFLESRWEPEPLDPATATLFVAVIRGLLLDRLTATDPDRVDAALGRFTELLESEHR